MSYSVGLSSILVVDDDPIAAEALRYTLTTCGYDVTVAGDGIEALDYVRTGNYRIVISDVEMPKMNGIEFVREAKSKHKDAAYFILTGFDFNADIEEAIEEGLIIKYFTKPFDQNLIRSYIEEFVSALS